MVINNVSAINSDDWLSPDPERAVVVLALGWDAGHSATAFSVNIAKYKLGKNHKFTNDCFFSHYDLLTAHSAPKPDKQYFAFSLIPGYYVYSGSNYRGAFLRGPLKLEDEVVFKAEAGKTIYLGDFIQTDKTSDIENCSWCDHRYELDFRQDLDSALNAVKKFRPLKKDVVPAEQLKIEGQRVPIPFCTL